MSDSLVNDSLWPLRRQLFQQTWPMAIGVLSLLGFQLVDAAFVSYLGTKPLAAQSFTFPITFLMIGVQVGLGIAIAALVSRAVGAGEVERSRRLGSLVLFGGSSALGVLALALWFGHGLIFSWLGASADNLERITPYWAIQLAANWLAALIYFGYSLFRAHNRTRLPGLLMVITSLLNLALDPVFIFGFGPVPGFGLPGAAIATVISFAIGLAILAWRLSRHDWLALHGLVDEIRRSTGPFAVIAGPAMVSQLMPALAAMTATGLIATLGDQAVAAWGLQNRLETMSLMVVLGLTMSLPPWLGHCYGANDWRRIRALTYIAFQAALVWQLVFGLAMAVAAPWVAAALAGAPAVQLGLTSLIRYMLPSYALLGICMLVVSAANALGWPLRAMMISFARLFVCYLPCVAVGVWAGSLTTIAIGALAGNCLAGVMAWVIFRRSLAGVSTGGNDNGDGSR